MNGIRKKILQGIGFGVAALLIVSILLTIIAPVVLFEIKLIILLAKMIL